MDLDQVNNEVTANKSKLKLHQQLPYLVANVVEILNLDEQTEDGGLQDENIQKNQRAVVIRTTQRSTMFLPVVGLVDPEKLKPGELVGVNKDTYLILDTLPPEYDNRVKTMEVDEKPTDDYVDIGGLDQQIEELKEAIVYPLTHPHLYKAIGIRPPKGVLLYGPPGTGKTLIARACAARTNACFIKISAPQLVQMYIGDGAKMVRDAFALAKEKAEQREKMNSKEGHQIEGATIIFIDEIDAIGTKRFDSDASGDREVQRTMLELLNQLDGFAPSDRVKVIAATNRPDILDPALVRSGRLDRKVEIPLPDLASRTHILRIHASKMKMSKDIDLAQISAICNDFSGAQLKAVCVEAGMIALRSNKQLILQSHLEDAVKEVQNKKKVHTQYYA
jgi:26S proteasome regulatory subunit T5